jgi:hypothetical protein
VPSTSLHHWLGFCRAGLQLPFITGMSAPGSSFNFPSSLAYARGRAFNFPSSLALPLGLSLQLPFITGHSCTSMAFNFPSSLAKACVIRMIILKIGFRRGCEWESKLTSSSIRTPFGHGRPRRVGGAQVFGFHTANQSRKPRGDGRSCITAARSSSTPRKPIAC